MILVDTSVWVDHFRAGVPTLVHRLEQSEVATHPFVLGEVALGNIRHRRPVLDLLAALSTTIVAHDEEVLKFIERRRLWGLGIGLVDVHLLCACHLWPGTRLWTRDKRLRSVAQEQGIEAEIE